mgnify:CR=1 FL=1
MSESKHAFSVTIDGIDHVAAGAMGQQFGDGKAMWRVASRLIRLCDPGGEVPPAILAGEKLPLIL